MVIYRYRTFLNTSAFKLQLVTAHHCRITTLPSFLNLSIKNIREVGTSSSCFFFLEIPHPAICLILVQSKYRFSKSLTQVDTGWPFPWPYHSSSLMCKEVSTEGPTDFWDPERPGCCLDFCQLDTTRVIGRREPWMRKYLH